MAPKRRHAEEQPVASSSRTKVEEIEPMAKRRRKASAAGSTKNAERTTTKRGSAEGTGSTKKATTRRRRDLSILHTMPFDVVYEVLARLSASDVVSVSRISKAWCELLSSKSMVSLWKELRHQEGILEPHPDISESRWAYLLLGHNCEVCGAKGVQMPDFGIRRRVCSSCKKQRLVVKKHITRQFPEYDIGIFDLLPSTKYKTSGLHAEEKPTAFYWSDDVHEMGKAWSKLQNNVWNKLPNAESEAQEFRERRLAIRNAIEASSKACVDWCKSAFNQKLDAKYKAFVSRRNEILKRFRNLGYTDSDLDVILSDNAVIQERELTERIWNTIKPKLEEQIRPLRGIRLANERGSLLIPAWESYAQSIAPIDRLTLPLLKELFGLPAFDTLAMAPDDIDEESEVISDLTAQLPQLVSTWQEQYRDKLRRSLIEEASDAPARGARVTIPKDGDVDILEAAVSPCMCYKYPCYYFPRGAIFGWKSTVQHRDCGIYEPTFCIADKQWNEIGTRLVQLAGLNPQTATWEDMDQSSMRVVCKICLEHDNGPANSSREDSLHEVEVYMWRQAAVHAIMDGHHSGARRYDWLVLDSTQLRSVFEKHELLPSHSWSCNHCHEYFTDPTTIDEVREHLIFEHHITKPVFPNDLFFLPVNTKPTCFQLKLWTESDPPSSWIRHGRFVCNHCDECWFELGDLETHIREEHGEAKALDEKDYTVRKFWEGYAPPPTLSYPQSP